MTRSRLPDRRAQLAFEVLEPGGELLMRPTRYTVGVGFPDPLMRDHPREVFISCHKTTTALDIAGRDIATLISIALQHGATVQELAAAVSRDDGGRPQGIAGVVLDAVTAEIAGGGA